MAKKSAKKKPVTKKAPKAKKAGKKVAVPRAKPVKKTTQKLAGTMETVPQPVVDVTAQVKQDVIELPPPPKDEPKSTPADKSATPAADEKHEEFKQALTAEPEKKPGFWARLFGKK